MNSEDCLAIEKRTAALFFFFFDMDDGSISADMDIAGERFCKDLAASDADQEMMVVVPDCFGNARETDIAGGSFCVDAAVVKLGLKIDIASLRADLSVVYEIDKADLLVS